MIMRPGKVEGVGNLTDWNARVMVNVWIGLIFGITAKTVSPTKPRDVDATPAALTCMPVCFATIHRWGSNIRSKKSDNIRRNSNLSDAVTSAQKFGAQYAWFKPLVKGNNRLRTWGICPIRAKGAKDRTKTAMIEFASDRKFLTWTRPIESKQNERRRYMKYAG